MELYICRLYKYIIINFRSCEKSEKTGIAIAHGKTCVDIKYKIFFYARPQDTLHVFSETDYRKSFYKYFMI